MKKVVVLLFASFLLLSCQDEVSEDRELRDLINFEKVSKTLNISYFSEDEFETLYLNHGNFNKNSSCYKSNFFSGKLQDNLYQTLFPLKILTQSEIEGFQRKVSDNIKLIGITGFHDNRGELKGAGFYFYNVTDSKLQYYLYRKNKSNFTLMEGFPKRTLDTDVKDITYVASMYFPTCDYSLIRLDTYDQFNLNYTSNELGLHLLNKHLQNNADFINSITVIRNENGNIHRMMGDPCSLAVHRCADGTPGSLCNGYYCVDMDGPEDQDTTIQDGEGSSGEEGSCSRKRVGSDIKKDQGEENYNQFISNLPLSKLYALKDILNATSRGKTYVYMYYYTNEYLIQTLDAGILLDMFNVSFGVGTAVDKYLNNDPGIIIDENLAKDLKKLFEKIRDKATSGEYKEFLDVLIFEIDNLKGLKKSEINNYLN